jgi:hypothetical protein
VDDNNSKFFILGCYKTDTPEDISSACSGLKTDHGEAALKKRTKTR